MAGRMSSAFRYSAIVLHLILLTSLNNGLRYGDKATTLHIVEDDHLSKGRQPLVINRDEHLHDDASETSSSRSRRDVPPEHPTNDPHILTKVRKFSWYSHRLYKLILPNESYEHKCHQPVSRIICVLFLSPYLVPQTCYARTRYH